MFVSQGQLAYIVDIRCLQMLGKLRSRGSKQIRRFYFAILPQAVIILFRIGEVISIKQLSHVKAYFTDPLFPHIDVYA